MRLARLREGGIVAQTSRGRVVAVDTLPEARRIVDRESSILDLLADKVIVDTLRRDLVRADEDGLGSDDPAPAVAAPVARPSKILGVSLNYADYCRRGNLDRPSRPKVFAKLANTVIGPGESIAVPDGLRASYEGELGVVIGQAARNVKGRDAVDAIAGYTIYNDVTAVDVVREDVQLLRGKNLDTFGPMGPWLVTPDEVPDPEDLRVRTVIDGVVRQESRTSEMIFGIAELIEFFSSFCTLEPGDVIATGTPAGTATQHEPPAFLQVGQVVSIEIEGLGLLENPVSLAEQ